MKLFVSFPQKESEYIFSKIFTPSEIIFLKHRITIYELYMQNLDNIWNPKDYFKLKEPRITKFLSRIFFLIPLVTVLLSSYDILLLCVLGPLPYAVLGHF